MEAAISASLNMAASMIKEAADADIQSAGKFGDRWTRGLHVDVEGSTGNMRISMYHDIDYAAVFEEGGTIHGNPLLWIGLSGTDAEGIPASQYPGGLFSAAHRDGKTPLLFSVSDKLPKYFGIASVTIPKLFHLSDAAKSVMGRFRDIFDREFRGGNG